MVESKEPSPLPAFGKVAQDWGNTHFRRMGTLNGSPGSRMGATSTRLPRLPLGTSRKEANFTSVHPRSLRYRVLNEPMGFLTLKVYRR
ncbi:hypothetical protein HOLleu_25621 [Holothuria leucospilota]|uniref:Uncharacterized protein n=1 Tax=Holothuria leucospilota TaxID=206669 RepID=A0A9Q1BSU0_HOLLE|nr:hypothetical protein HOLleu_25621 [Holothuria leucospilota]